MDPSDLENKTSLNAETNPMIRVMIADDHAMVRRGLVTFLTVHADIQVVGEARDGREAVQLCEETQPDVVLMDLLMPEMGGVEAARLILQRWPQVQIIALTSFQEKELVQEILQAGAISYLLKNLSGNELAAAIRAAYQGKATIAPEAVQALVRSTAAEPKIGSDLTPREREVLGLLVTGLHNPEIAEKLCVSQSTAKAHVSNILSKLGVSNRSEAVALAIHNDLIP